MNEKTPDTLLRDYLKGRLAKDESETLERWLATDPDLREEFARQRIEVAAAEMLIAAESRQLFEKWKAETGSPPQPFWKKPTFWSLITGLLLTAAAFFFFKKTENPAPQRLIPTPETRTPAPTPTPQAKEKRQLEMPKTEPPKPRNPNPETPKPQIIAMRHFQEPDFSVLRTAASDSSLTSLDRAKLDYQAGNFKKCLLFLAKTDSSQWQSATFLAANARFRLGRYAEAAADFERLVARNSRQFRYPAEWGLLLSRLAQGPRAEAAFRAQLDEILAKPEHPFFEQANALRKETF